MGTRDDLNDICPKTRVMRLINNRKSLSLKFNFFVLDNAHHNLGPVYTSTNTQRIAIYPGKFKFVLVKISPDSGRLHGRHAKENQTPVTIFYYWKFIRTSLFTQVQISKFIQLCSEFTQVNAFTR